ncbi:MAG: hypothetical protein KF709_13035 [Gemmatimonadaceae bacterium]|nr:hypothetical protein [Gemmatimonadaceae bacterium]
MFSLILIVGIIAMVISARRFAARKEREGTWDRNGPLHPTTGPMLASEIFDSGLRRAWEHQHGPEGTHLPYAREMPPIVPPLDDDNAPR